MVPRQPETLISFQDIQPTVLLLTEIFSTSKYLPVGEIHKNA